VGSYPLSKESGVHTCAVSEAPVPVAGAEFVEDVYGRILEYGEYGMFTREKYEELPRHRHYLIRGHVMRWIKDGNLTEFPENPEARYIRDKYPQYWKEAEVLRENGLL